MPYQQHKKNNFLVSLLTICILSACGGQVADSSISEQGAPAPVFASGSSSSATPVASSVEHPVLPDSADPSDLPAAQKAALGAPAVSSANSATTSLPVLTIESTAPLSSADQTFVPVSFGQVFVAGALLPTDRLVSTDSVVLNGMWQTDVKALHADGSVRHAIVSGVLPKLRQGQIQTISFAKEANSAKEPGTGPAALLNAGLTARVDINVAGVAYSASPQSFLKAGKYLTWLAGPYVNEWIVSAPLTTPAGVAHPHLSARFAIRTFSPLNKTRVDVTVENNWAYEPGPQNLVYDAAIIVGGHTVYSKSALTHYHHARWRKAFWWGAEPQVHVKHDPAYLIATKAVPNYDQTVKISAAALSSVRSKFTGSKTEPMGSGLAAPYMPTTGGRPDIGLLPGWAVTYLLSMDKDAKLAMLGTADLAGSWSAHYRDKNTDRPISLMDYPYMTLLGTPGDTLNPVTKKYEKFPACGGTCTTPNVADTPHMPNFAYLPYLVTGDYYYLEELQFWAMWAMFQKNPGYRENVKGLLYPDQVRGQGWSLRTLAEAAYITPDSDPFKAQFAKFLDNNLDWYNNAYSNNAKPANSLGAITDNNAVVYDGNKGLAPWMDDFFTSAVGHVAELGYAKAQPLLAWKAKFPISRMNGPGFCWILGSIYSLNVRDSASSPIYTSIDKAYLASNPSALTSLECGSPAMASYLKLKVGEMGGYSSENIGYPSNMQPALAYSVDSGATDGAKAWSTFMARSVKPDYSSGPQFAIVPRSPSQSNNSGSPAGSTSLSASGMGAYFDVGYRQVNIRWVDPADGGSYALKLYNGSKTIYYGGAYSGYAPVNYANFNLTGSEILTGQFVKYAADRSWVKDYPQFVIDLSKINNLGTSAGSPVSLTTRPSAASGMGAYYDVGTREITIRWAIASDGGSYVLKLYNGSQTIYYGGTYSDYAPVNYANFKLTGSEILTGYFMEYGADRNWVRDYPQFAIDLSHLPK